jgi:hypothetical protein
MRREAQRGEAPEVTSDSLRSPIKLDLIPDFIGTEGAGF